MRRLIFTAIVLLLTHQHCYADYVPTELFVIGWGDNSDQLKMRPEEITYYDPGGVASGYDVDSGAGPTGVFVDNEENFIFYSSHFGQLKAFNALGELVFDYSYGAPGYSQEIHSGGIEGIYVNSNLEMYVVDAYDRKFVSVIDYSGEIINKIYPFAPDSSIPILSLYPKFNGDICFYGLDQGFVTFSNGEIKPGGTSGFMVSNGNFYTVWSHTSNSLKFNEYQNPDTSGRAETREFIEVEYPDETIYSAGVLAGGNGDRLYVVVISDSTGGGEIWELELDFNIIDKLEYEVSPEGTVWGLDTFIHSNGNIYRFQCLEDGVHVIRWSKG